MQGEGDSRVLHPQGLGEHLHSGDGVGKKSTTEPDAYYPPPNNDVLIKSADQVIVSDRADLTGVPFFRY